MDTLKIENKGNTKMIAHRGASSLERENSMPAFVAAGNRSYYGIETDVHITGDGKFVIIHDNSTGRVAGGNDVAVEISNYDVLRNIQLSDIDGGIGRIDLGIPSLEEYINCCKRYDKTAVLELKNQMKENNIKEMINIIETLSYLDKVVFISFCLDNLLVLRRLLPEQKIQFLTGAYNSEIHATLKKNNFGLDAHYSVISKEAVDAMHGDGIEVNCWTCDDAVIAERLCGWGVDYITTNRLE